MLHRSRCSVRGLSGASHSYLLEEQERAGAGGFGTHYPRILTLSRREVSTPRHSKGLAMTDEDTAAADAPEMPTPKEKRGEKTAKKRAKGGRELSTIAFSYMDLEAAISIALGIFQGGGVPLSRDQLAGMLSLSLGSGNFVTKVATARMFGLVNFVQSKYELTDLGFSILDSDEKRHRKARADAFLTVPLYKRAYEEFCGRQLPPRPHGLEQAFLKFGVAPKQGKRARLAFDKSAARQGISQTAWTG